MKKMFAKDIKAGYPEYKASGLVNDVIKILESQSTDLKKFVEKLDSNKANFEFFYLFWNLFFDVIPREALTKERLLGSMDKITEISSFLSLSSP